MAKKTRPFDRDEPALLQRCAQALTQWHTADAAAAPEFAVAAPAQASSILPDQPKPIPAECQTIWAELQRTPDGSHAMGLPAMSAPLQMPVSDTQTAAADRLAAEAISRAFERDARRYG